MKTLHIPTLAMTCCALFVAGCKPKASNNSNAVSELTASTGGRDLHVVSTRGAWVNQQENAFTVKVAGHEIVIDREHVLVDKKVTAKVPSGAKKFEVTVADGTLAVTADGSKILEAPLAK